MRDNIIIYLIIALFYLVIFCTIYSLHGIEWTIVAGLAIISTNQLMRKDKEKN